MTMLANTAARAANTNPVVPLIDSARAELMRQHRWPAYWVLLGVWSLLNLAFGYVLDYIAYATGSENFASEGVPPAGLLARMLPDAVPGLLTNGMPMFGGAIMLTLGALTTGGGYGWGTWKTILTQGPGRIGSYGGTLIALAVAVVTAVTATLVVDLAASTLIALAESQGVAAPDLGDLATSVGGGVLILGMWTSIGALIGTLARNPAIAIGLGLVWSLVVENLLRGAAGLLPDLEYLTNVTPGTAAGSIAGALASRGPGADAPGMLGVLDGGTAALLAGAYIVIAVTLAFVLVRRRDVA